MTLPAEYWESFEHDVSSLAEVLEAIQMISAYQAATGSRFVWRGVADCDWPLYSSLVRAFIAKFGVVPMEPDLRQFELGVVTSLGLV